MMKCGYEMKKCLVDYLRARVEKERTVITNVIAAPVRARLSKELDK